MFKLKIINKPKMIKMKCNIEFPDVVLANLQEKEVTPTKEIQEIKADQQYDGLSKVVVNAIPSEYIIPSGDITITASGTYDVKDKINAIVDIKEKQLGTKKITENGTYKAADDNLDGYSEVEVATTGVDINDYYISKLPSKYYNSNIGYFIKNVPSLDLSNCMSMEQFFQNCKSLETIPTLNISHITNTNSMFASCSSLKSISQLDTSNVVNMGSMFASCSKLKSIPQLNTNKVTYMGWMFSQCTLLETIPQLDTSNVTNISNIVDNCRYLENLGGFENLGMAYEISQSANYSNYTLKLSGSNNLTHESLMNVINNLYDIKTKGCNAQKLILGTTNINKLTSEEIAIATSRGWSVS